MITQNDGIISDKRFSKLREEIYDKCGIRFNDTKNIFLKNKILKRMRQCKIETFDEFCKLLKSGTVANQRREFSTFVNILTVNESYFFRFIPQLDVLKKYVLPKLITNCQKLKRKKIRIWSAGCSTGEEPFTLAIILTEELKNLSVSLNIEIIASDICEDVLEFGKSGKYSDYAMKNVPENLIHKYFEYDGHTTFEVKKNLKKVITFKKANLINKMDLIGFKKFDLVFCRNVIIYFDILIKTKVIETFYNSLIPEGYLFLGHSEYLTRIKNSFTGTAKNRIQFYKKDNNYA